MRDKITSITVNYPEGHEPDVVIPKEFMPFRYVIGKDGDNPLVAICMNPSAARDNVSDRTVNRVVKASIDLGYDGWFVVNIYPERATDAALLDEINQGQLEENVKEIKKLLREKNIKEVWGAWGECKYEQLRMGRDALLKMLEEEGVKVFAFQVNASGNPKHPLYLKLEGKEKIYL